MSNCFAFLSCVLLLLVGCTSCVKRQLLNFQVYEEANVLNSVLYVESLVDLNAELRPSEGPADAVPVEEPPPPAEVWDAQINVRLPIQMKIHGKLSKIKTGWTGEKRNASDAERHETGERFARTTYKLKLNVDELYKLYGDVNHTQHDNLHEYTSDLNFGSLQSGLLGKYKGTLRLNKNQCPSLTLFHNFTTNAEGLVRFSSNVTEQCGLTNDRHETEDRVKITIDFSTLINDLFDFRLDQVFVRQANSGSELMTLLNRIYNVTVTGNYDYGNRRGDEHANATTHEYQFYKKAIFESSVPSRFPSFQIKYSHDEKNKNRVKMAFEIKNDRRPASRKDERKNETRDGRRTEL